MSSKYFDQVAEKVSPELKIFTAMSFDIVDRIHFLLKQKGLTQKDLAEKLGKQESEISKWLSPGHNFTLKSIVKLEVSLDEKIISIPQSPEMVIKASTLPAYDNLANPSR